MFTFSIFFGLFACSNITAKQTNTNVVEEEPDALVLSFQLESAGGIAGNAVPYFVALQTAT